MLSRGFFWSTTACRKWSDGTGSVPGKQSYGWHFIFVLFILSRVPADAMWGPHSEDSGALLMEGRGTARLPLSLISQQDWSLIDLLNPQGDTVVPVAVSHSPVRLLHLHWALYYSEAWGLSCQDCVFAQVSFNTFDLLTEV